MSESERPTVATDNPVNVSDAAEQQKLQAAQEIENDPQINEGGAVADEYDDESKYTYRDLQGLAKDRDLDASGKRDEIVARLREADSAKTGAAPSGSSDAAAASANGGIKLDMGISGSHADVLQSLSDARKKAQLEAVAQAEQG